MTKPYFRMPIGFGPFPGPRQIPVPGQRDPHSSPERAVASVVFETEKDAIARILPPGFFPADDTRIIFEAQHLRKVDWLAGRGYSTLAVKFPATFHARGGPVEGDFLAVLWENLADPILSGREELGYAKLWCEIEEAGRPADARFFSASWLGHLFLDMELNELHPATEPAPARRPLLHYKYIPKTGCPGEADANYATITPAENPTLIVTERLVGLGKVHFHRSTWEQLPTLFHIVNALADLTLGKLRSATWVVSRGGKDLADQRILEPA